METKYEMWHIINGEWRHICQVLNEDKIRYYTDGKLECERKIEHVHRSEWED